MGIVYFLASLLLGVVLLPIGIVYGLFLCFWKHRISSGFITANTKLLLLATAFDKYGNVVCAELFNATLIKKTSIVRFGHIEQTISQVIGYNILSNTLTKTGIRVNQVLDCLFGKNHALNAIISNL